MKRFILSLIFLLIPSLCFAQAAAPPFIGTVTSAGTAITTLTCQAQTAQTVNGVVATDICICSPAALLGAAGLSCFVIPTANTMTAQICNQTAGSVTPSATVLNLACWHL